MISEWVPMELPLGLGMDTSSNPAALPPGTLRDLENVGFNQANELVKRYGFDTLLDTLPSAPKLFKYQGHLLAQQGGSLWDFSTNSNGVAAGKFQSRGKLRSVPCRSRVAASEASDVPQCAAAAAAQFTCLAWLYGTGINTVIKYQVIDENTGTVVATGSFATPSDPPTDFSIAGQAISGRATFVLAWGNYVAAVYGAGDSNWYVSTINTLGNANAKHAKVIFRPSVGEVYVLSATATQHYTAHLQVNVGNPPTFTSLGSATTVIGVDITNPTLAMAYTTSPLYLTELVYRSAGTLTCYLRDVSTCALVTSFDVATVNRPAHIALAASTSGSTRLTALYDDGTVACNLSMVSGIDITSGGFTGSGLNGVLFRGAQLASGALYASNFDLSTTDCYFAVEYVSVVTPNLANALGSGATLADGTVMTAAQAASLQLPTLNSVHMLVTLAGAVVSRTLRARALLQTQTPPLVATQAGLVTAARAVSQADTVTIASTLSLGAAALVYADLTVEAPRTSEAAKQLFVSGGSPTGYAGDVPVEHNFAVYPEIISSLPTVLYTGSTTAYATTHTVADNTPYAVGAKVWPGYNGSSGVETDETKAEVLGSVFVCVKAGTTSTGSASAMHVDLNVGDKITLGTAVFMRCGFPGTTAYSVGTAALLGRVYTPSTPNGNGYVLTGTVTGGNLGTEPTWPTTKGSTVTGAAGAGAAYYTCIGPLPSLPTTGLSYTYASCYAWVDAQGNLHRSALSPMSAQSQGPTGAPPLLVITALRCTQKTGARIEIYATDGNGTLLQLEAALPNDPSVDAVGWSHQVADATQAIGAVCYQGPLGAGGLPNTPPPPCSTLAVWGQRVATNDGENPYRVALSQLCVDGYGLAWSDVTSVLVNNQYGAVGVVAVMDSALVIFQETAISIMQGDGPDNTGAGNAFTEPQVVATDVGCTDPSSVVLTPKGLVFRSQKGVYLLDRSTGTDFVGEPVQLVTALMANLMNAVVDPSTRQIILLTAVGTMYNFDYARRAWGLWSSTAFSSLCTWQNPLVASDSTGRVYQQSQSGYNDPDGAGGLVGLQASFRIASARFNGVQGYGRARGAKLLFRSNGGNQISVAVRHDYSDTDTQAAAAYTLVAGIDEMEVRFSKQRSAAIGLRVIESVGYNGPLEFLGVTFEVGILAGTTRVSPTTKRTK